MSQSGSTIVAPGLEGVVVAETALSEVDGLNGRLAYRGFSIDDLARHATYEEVLYLLWHGNLPARDELAALHRELAANRALPEEVRRAIEALPRSGEPIDALRAGVTALGMTDPEIRDLSPEGILRRGLRLVAMMPTMLAAYARLRQGEQPVEPDPELGQAGNFLSMLYGRRPTETQQAAFNCYLVLLAEHSLNASTFALRVTISTLADLYAAVAAALAALKGDAHGGANQRAMEMLLEIGSPDNVVDYVEESLRIKRRLMGIGHRVYRTRDPRAAHLMGWSKAVAEESGETTWHTIAERLEEVTANHPYYVERKLYPNVEFYSAPLLYGLGLAPDLMPGAFAISRVAGWVAHALEQLASNRLIRPQASYVGERERHFVPLDQRG
uniref:Citrate synthase n=1 Tax=Thermorudis peleae TaxID=1382356 RepID=A0A831X161_9BACT